MAANNNMGQGGSGKNPGNINPINRTSSTQPKNGKGIDLSPFVGLDGSVKQLDKKLDTFIGKLDQLTNNIVTAINNQKSQSNSFQQPQNNNPQFGERTPDLNDSKNSGTVDFNREILASIRKQADTTRLLVDSLLPNIEIIKESIVASINSNKVSTTISENPNISSTLESAQLTADQVGVFETFTNTFSDSIKLTLQDGFDSVIETQRDMFVAMKQYSVQTSQTPIDINDLFNQSIDKNQLIETQKQLTDMFSQLPKHINGSATQQKTEPSVQVVEKHVTRTVDNIESANNQSSLGISGYKVSAIAERDNYVNIPNVVDYLGGSGKPTMLDTTRSAILGEYSLNQTDQPEYIKTDSRFQGERYMDGVEVGGLNPRQTIPLMNVDDLSSFFTKSDYINSTPKQIQYITGDGGANLVQQNAADIISSEQFDTSFFGSKFSRFNEFLNTPFDEQLRIGSNRTGGESDDNQFIETGRSSFFDMLFGEKESVGEGELVDETKPTTLIDILSPGSTLAQAQTTGLGLLLLSLSKQQVDGFSRSEGLLANLYETNNVSGKSLSSLSSLLLEDSKQRAADKALGNLGSTGGLDLSGLFSGSESGSGLKQMLTEAANNSESGDGGGLGLESLLAMKGGTTALNALLGKGGASASAGAAKGLSMKGIMSAKIGGGVGSGLAMGALVGTAAVLATKLGVLAFRGEADEQMLKTELAQRNEAMTEAVQVRQRAQAYQTRLQDRQQSLMKRAEDRNALDKINVQLQGDQANAYSQRQYAQQLAKISQAELQDDKMKDDDLAKIDETLRKEQGTERVNFLKNVQTIDNVMDDAGDDAKAGKWDNEPFWLTESEINMGKTHSYENLTRLQGIVQKKLGMARAQFNKWGPQRQAKRAIEALTTYQSKLNMKVRMIKQRDDKIKEYEEQRKKVQAERERRAAEEKRRLEAQQRQAEEQGNSANAASREFNKDVESTPATELLADIKDKIPAEEYDKLQKDLQSDDPEVKAAAENRIKELYSGFKAAPTPAANGLQTEGTVTAPQQQVAETTEAISEQDRAEAERQARLEAERQQREQAEVARNEQIARDTQRMADSSERQATAAEQTATNSNRPPVQVTHVVPSSNNLTTGPITTTKV